MVCARRGSGMAERGDVGAGASTLNHTGTHTGGGAECTALQADVRTVQHHGIVDGVSTSI